LSRGKLKVIFILLIYAFVLNVNQPLKKSSINLNFIFANADFVPRGKHIPSRLQNLIG